MTGRKIAFTLGLIAFVMLVMPLLAVRLVPADAGMAVCFVLFFAVNPAFSIGLGILAGADIKRLWYFPAVNAACFLAASCAVFSADMAFVLYAIVYLCLGAASAGITALFFKTK